MTWEYYAEAIRAGSFHQTLGGDSASDSLAKLAARLNIIGTEGWELVSIQRMTSVHQTYESEPAIQDVYYECVFMRSAGESDAIKTAG